MRHSSLFSDQFSLGAGLELGLLTGYRCRAEGAFADHLVAAAMAIDQCGLITLGAGIDFFRVHQVSQHGLKTFDPILHSVSAGKVDSSFRSLRGNPRSNNSLLINSATSDVETR